MWLDQGDGLHWPMSHRRYVFAAIDQYPRRDTYLLYWPMSQWRHASAAIDQYLSVDMYLLYWPMSHRRYVFTSSLTLDISTKNAASRYSKLPRSRLCLVSVPTCRCFAIVSTESACCVWYLRSVHVCKIFEDKGKKQYSLSLFQTQSRGLSWLVRCDLYTHLSIFCDCSAFKVLVAFGIYGVCKVFEDKPKKQCPLLIFRTPGAVSCLVRQDLRTCLPIFCDCKCLLHWCLTVCTYTRSSRTKRRCNTFYRYSKLPAVSCLVRRDLRTYLPMFRETWTADFSNWSTASRNVVHGRVFGLYGYGCHFREKQSPSERKCAAAALCNAANL